MLVHAHGRTSYCLVMAVEDEVARIQLSGLLSKKPMGVRTSGTSSWANWWSKRFFVIKDGFLLFYAEGEKKEFEKRRCISLHPKGVVPLGECSFSRTEEADNRWLILIHNEVTLDRLLLMCESQYEQEKWMEMLEKSARISWRNAVLSDMLIQQLQTQGAKLAEEKQDMYLRLHDEVKLLSMEKEKTEEMAKIVEAMKEEKLKLSRAAVELGTQLQQITAELELTSKTLKEVENEKDDMMKEQSNVEALLISLAKDKVTTEERLKHTEVKTQELIEQNLQLSSDKEVIIEELDDQLKREQKVKAELEQQLHEIEKDMLRALEEKQKAEHRVKEQSDLAEILRQEKEIFHAEAKELQSNLQDIKLQKEMTETELREEVKARLYAEQQLREAQMALQGIESRLNESGAVTQEQKQQMMLNVKALKRYFEVKAIEERVEADKPIIMKNSVYNKRRNMRAKSVRIIQSSKLQNGVVLRRDSHTAEPGSPSSSATLRCRRAASLLLQDTEMRRAVSESANGSHF